MRIINDIKLDFCDVLICPHRSSAISRNDVDLHRTFTFKNSKKSWTGIPIIASNMDATGTIAMAKAIHKYNMVTCLHKYYELDKLREFFASLNGNDFEHTFYTMGINDKDYEKLIDFINMMDFDMELNICIDTPNGYTDVFVNKCAKIRERFPRSIIMAGNVCTPEIVEELVLHGGVDIIKIGLGSGSVCLTRTITGVGYPQLTSIIECADAAHGLQAHICADGGIATSSDIAKSFGGGADFVMCGNLFAGCDECEGEWIYHLASTDPAIFKPKHKSFKFYGMASQEALEKYNNDKEYRALEGECITINAKGPVKSIVRQILGGLRSTCAYVGAVRLKDLSKKTTFIRVNRIK